MSIYDQHYSRLRGTIVPIEHALKATTAELVFFASFLVNFVAGKLVHYFSPEEEVYSYYTNKKNFLNQIFVKRGWGWTTLAIVVFYALVLTRPKRNSVKQPQPTAKTLAVAAIRYALVTSWWILFTQWCFGQPIMDRIFVWTGGRCEVEAVQQGFEDLFKVAHEAKEGGAAHAIEKGAQLFHSNVITSYHCRKLRGSWTGGHDPSGHVFLMIHSCLYLFLEGLPFWVSWSEFWRNTSGVVKTIRVTGRWHSLAPYVRSNPHVFLISLIGLWWFMLFMTNVYFHSIAEKFVGLLFGYSGIIAVYYVPRWLNWEF